MNAVVRFFHVGGGRDSCMVASVFDVACEALSGLCFIQIRNSHTRPVCHLGGSRGERQWFLDDNDCAIPCRGLSRGKHAQTRALPLPVGTRCLSTHAGLNQRRCVFLKIMTRPANRDYSIRD